MANEKLVTLEQLGIVKNYISAKNDSTLKSAEYTENTIKLYTTADKTGEPAVTLDLPEEMFLDQAKTSLVDEFAWSDTEYPNSDNPNLDGKPVLVLAVKGDKTVSYSFISMEKFITIYEGQNTDTATVSATNGKISVGVKISEITGNVLTANDDGLSVVLPEPEPLAYATDEEVETLFSD